MKYIYLVIGLIIGSLLTGTVLAATFSERLAGRILLQVESHGEAWYVNPIDGKRYYLKDGDHAYEFLRKFGLGISSSDLSSIPIGDIPQLSDATLEKRAQLCSVAGFGDKPTNDDSCPAPTEKIIYVESPGYDCSNNVTEKIVYQDRVTNNCPEDTANTTPTETVYSPYVLYYEPLTDLDCPFEGNQVTIPFTTSRDIRWKKITFKAYNLPMEQTVAITIPYETSNGGSSSRSISLQQVAADTWQTTNEIPVKASNHVISWIKIVPSSACGAPTSFQPVFTEWEAWDYTSNLPVKILPL